MVVYMADTVNLIFRDKGKEYLEKEILSKCVPVKRVTKKGATLEYLIEVEEKGSVENASPESN